MNAQEKTQELIRKLNLAEIPATFEQAETLRRAEITLQRWGEGEAGDSNDYRSVAIERDEETGIPYRYTHPKNGESYRTKIPDRETLALQRVARVCEELGISYYHQGDCRGASLYVSKEKLTQEDYTRGVCCSMR